MKDIKRDFIPEGASVQTYVVYDRESGNIVHVHEVVEFEEPRERVGRIEKVPVDEGRDDALRFGAQNAETDPGNLDTFRVEREELMTFKPIKVDTKARKIVPIRQKGE